MLDMASLLHKLILVYLFIFCLEQKWIEGLNLRNGSGQGHDSGNNVDMLRIRRDADDGTGQSTTTQKASTSTATTATTASSGPATSSSTSQTTSTSTSAPPSDKVSSDDHKKQPLQISKTLEEYDTCVKNRDTKGKVQEVTYFTTQTVRLSCNYCFRPETDIDAVKLKWTRQRKYSRYAAHVPIDTTRFTVGDNHDLVINGILAEDAGRYICRGELDTENNEEDLDDQSTYEVTVLHHGSGAEETYDKCLLKKEEIWSSGKNPVEPLMFTLGQTARITCHVCQDKKISPESINIKWQRGAKDGDSFREIPQDDPHYKEDGLDLVIAEVQEEDGGGYRCTGEQSRVESSYLVDVTGMSMEPTEAVLFITGHHAVLKCQVGEETDIELEWRYQSFHGGSRHILPLDGKKYIFSKDFNLIITSLTPKDAGNYECRNIHHSLYSLDPEDSDRDVDPEDSDRALDPEDSDRAPGWEVVARYHMDIVAHEKILQKAEWDKKSDVLSDRELPENNLLVWTVWSDWMPCDTCNEAGHRRRIGICKVKLLHPEEPVKPEDIPVLGKYISGLPCRSPSLPSAYATKSEISQRPSELLIDKCKVKCKRQPMPLTGANSSVVTDEGIDGAPEDLDTESIMMSLTHQPVFSPVVKTETIYTKPGGLLLLDCPRVGESTSSIEWQNKTSVINTDEAAANEADQALADEALADVEKETKGNVTGSGEHTGSGKHVEITENHQLLINELQPGDDTSFTCWSEGDHIGTMSVVYGEPPSGSLRTPGLIISGLFILICIVGGMYYYLWPRFCGEDKEKPAAKSSMNTTSGLLANPGSPSYNALNPPPDQSSYHGSQGRMPQGSQGSLRSQRGRGSAHSYRSQGSGGGGGQMMYLDDDSPYDYPADAVRQSFTGSGASRNSRFSENPGSEQMMYLDDDESPYDYPYGK